MTVDDSIAALRYDTVLFDVGGTLIGFFDPAPFAEFLRGAGLPASDDDARAFHRRFTAAVVAERDTAQGLGSQRELFSWWHAIFERTWPDRPDLAGEMDRWLAAGRLDRVFPDAVPALDALRAQGVRMGVLSNFVGYLPDLLERLGLRRYFDFVVVSALVDLAKPDPRIFHLAAEQSGVPRERLLYVGDHIGDDVEGARSAGLDAVLIDRAGRHAGAACARIGALGDLVRYLRPPAAPAEAILFDWDGVVLDSMPSHLDTWQQALAPLGIRPTAEDLYPLEGMPTEPTARLLTERLLGTACSEEEARRLAATKRELFVRQFSPRFVPGTLPLLHDLHGRGYRLGLVTGSHRSVVDRYLDPAGLAGLFEAIVTSDVVAHGKPDPEPYRTASAMLGVRPSGCLAVENAPLGVQSAKAAGMRCLAVETSLPADRLRAADRTFSSVPDLAGWLLEAWKSG